MKATYNATTKTKYTTSHRKEDKCFFSSMQVIDLDAQPWTDGRIGAVTEARLYGTGNQNTCCLWINQKGSLHAMELTPIIKDGIHTQGSGKAGGYGYHRPSAALGEAIRNAGFMLDEDINGRGESVMKEALLAIAAAIGVKRPAIVESYQ